MPGSTKIRKKGVLSQALLASQIQPRRRSLGAPRKRLLSPEIYSVINF